MTKPGRFYFGFDPIACKRQNQSGTKTFRIRDESGMISSSVSLCQPFQHCLKSRSNTRNISTQYIVTSIRATCCKGLVTLLYHHPTSCNWVAEGRPKAGNILRGREAKRGQDIVRARGQKLAIFCARLDGS